MDKIRLQYWLFWLLLLDFLALAFTGYDLWVGKHFIFGHELWLYHRVFAIALLVLVIMHIYLNWRFISHGRKEITRSNSRQTQN